MRVGIFYNSISNPVKFSNKNNLMDNFKDGVLINNDHILEYRERNSPIDGGLDAGFILGYTLENNFRKHIITNLENNDIFRIYVDSNILNYANPAHEWHRYSLNSVYPSDGIYFYGQELDKTKWDTFSKFHGVTAKPWRSNGNHILILCQRSNGWNLFGSNQERWLYKTITKIKKHSDRPIVIRMHPGDRNRFSLINAMKERYGSSITISENPNIFQDLRNCWCSVGYNSTPNVVSIIEGVPAIISDGVNSWASGMASTMLNSIENPLMPDRNEWIHRVANIHWSNQEIKSGKLWSNIKNYISSVRR